MRHNTDIILKIKELRRKGYSVPEISVLSSIPKSTVLRYVRDITIPPKYLPRWLERKKSGRRISERHWQEARAKTKKWLTKISKKELVLIGTMLYWAEGAKKGFSFSNTDPIMIKTFLYVLRSYFKVLNDDIKISIRIYDDLNEKECIEYWSKITEIDLKNNVSINKLQGFKKGKLKYGMCRLRVKKADKIHKEIFSIIDQLNRILSPCSSTDRTEAS